MVFLPSFTRNRRPVIFHLAFSAAVATGCGSIPEFPASGVVAGYEFSGPVDSPLGREFLEGNELPEDLAKLRRRVQEGESLPSSSDLEDWTKRYSPDVATLLFVEAVAALPRHAAANDLYRHSEQELRTAALLRTVLALATPVEGAIVP